MGTHDLRMQIRVLLRVHPIHWGPENRYRLTAQCDRLPVSCGIDTCGETACDNDFIANQSTHQLAGPSQ